MGEGSSMISLSPAQVKYKQTERVPQILPSTKSPMGWDSMGSNRTSVCWVSIMQISMIPLGIKWSGRVRSLFGVVLAWVPFNPRPFFLLWGLTSLGSSLHLAVVLGLYQVENPVEA